MSFIVSGMSGSMRIEEVDTALMLPQILRLRAMVARRVSLAPDLTSWLDPLDARATHWGVFCGAQLVAAARLCVHAFFPEIHDAFFRSLDTELSGPVPVMSHCVALPRLRSLQLESVLDAACIERAQQLRLGVVLAVAESPRRVAALEAQGFDSHPSANGRSVLVRRAARKPRTQEPRARIVRTRVPSRT